MRDLIGLDAVLIYYPGHLATAVKFNQSVSGDYIIYGDSRYVVCDPTYINAPVGMTMPEMDNSTSFVVVLQVIRFIGHLSFFYLRATILQVR